MSDDYSLLSFIHNLEVTTAAQHADFNAIISQIEQPFIPRLIILSQRFKKVKQARNQQAVKTNELRQQFLQSFRSNFSNQKDLIAISEEVLQDDFYSSGDMNPADEIARLLKRNNVESVRETPTEDVETQVQEILTPYYQYLQELQHQQRLEGLLEGINNRFQNLECRCNKQINQALVAFVEKQNAQKTNFKFIGDIHKNQTALPMTSFMKVCLELRKVLVKLGRMNNGKSSNPKHMEYLKTVLPDLPRKANAQTPVIDQFERWGFDMNKIQQMVLQILHHRMLGKTINSGTKWFDDMTNRISQKSALQVISAISLTKLQQSEQIAA